MTAEEFTRIKNKLGLSAKQLAVRLELPGKKDGRTVRRWASGEFPVPGPVSIAMRCFRDHG